MEGQKGKNEEDFVSFYGTDYDPETRERDEVEFLDSTENFLDGMEEFNESIPDCGRQIPNLLDFDEND